MLQAIRDKAQGWIAWAIVILITIPFALFGIQEYLGGGADPEVAKIEGMEITRSDLDRRVRDARENMRAMLGESYRQEMFEGEVFEKQVLEQMVEENLLGQTASDWNMRTSDAQVLAFIHSVPSFQTDGKFDPKLYELAVRNRGLSNAGFEELVRQDLVMRQLQAGIEKTGFVTDAELAEQTRLGEQQRSIRYLRIPREEFAGAEVSDQAAREFYQANSARFRVPERVKLAYVRLNLSHLMPLVELDEQQLRDFYLDHQSEFVAPEERRLRHILIAGDGQEQQAQAQALLQQLRDGADFAELAKANSADPGSAANGGDLGWVSRGVMVAPFEEASFGLQTGVVSEPVKTQFGYHLIEVTRIRGGSDAGFEELRDQVEQAYRRMQAEDMYFNTVERLADAAYENSDSLQPAAELLELDVSSTGWVQRSGGGLPEGLDSPKLVNAAFSEDVLERGHNSALIELEPTDAVVLRVLEHQTESTRPFEDVKPEILTAVAARDASDKAAEQGGQVIEQLRGGAAMDGIAADRQWKMVEATIGRDNLGQPAELVDSAFSATPPQNGKPGFTGVVSAEGDYFVIQIDSVTDGDAGSADKSSERAGLQRELGRAEYSGLVQALRERSDIQLFKP